MNTLGKKAKRIQKEKKTNNVQQKPHNHDCAVFSCGLTLLFLLFAFSWSFDVYSTLVDSCCF